MRILDAIRSIPEGFVRTYGDVSPGAPRLAGRLLGSVHAADLPWWRVVRADGSLAAGEEQRRRLECEGVPFRPGPAERVDLRAARIAHVVSPADGEAAWPGRAVTKLR
jgi:methylated-DNA-protein-cysteine methyltransferase related protein